MAVASLALAGILACVSQLVESRATNVECHPANNGQEESGNNANTVVTYRAANMLSSHGAGDAHWFKPPVMHTPHPYMCHSLTEAP